MYSVQCLIEYCSRLLDHESRYNSIVVKSVHHCLHVLLTTYICYCGNRVANKTTIGLFLQLLVTDLVTPTLISFNSNTIYI